MSQKWARRKKEKNKDNDKDKDRERGRTRDRSKGGAGRGINSTYSEGALEGDVVARDAVNGRVGDDSLAVLELGGDVDSLPLDWYL